MDQTITPDTEAERLGNILATYGIANSAATIPVASDTTSDTFFSKFTPLSEFPPFVPEDDNDDILVRGRWLERGGAAFVVSTAGTGKSIHSLQTALCWSQGMEFSGLAPRKPLKVWIIQSEDSPTRITIDREDIVAELSERMPEVDWRAAARKVQFVRLTGVVGAEWLEALDKLLTDAERHGVAPDVIIINPFMAFIGGPVSDSAYVTPFLRGGEIMRTRTCGLQDILERHRVGALIYHHTPKPPTEKEVEAWLKSSFPEYQGAGSSDITNWGRSFITMMRVPKHPRAVMLTAGKNGGGLGWDETDGARRMYLHWSDGDSIDTGARHAWRECTQEEIAEMSGGAAENTLNRDVERLCEFVKERPSCQSDFFAAGMGTGKVYQDLGCGLSRDRFRSAWAYMRANADALGIESAVVPVGRGLSVVVFGTGAGVRTRAAHEAGQRGIPPSLVKYSATGADRCGTGAGAPVADRCGRMGYSPLGEYPPAAPVNLVQEPLF